MREVFRVNDRQGRQLLAGWLSWASHSGIPELVTLAASIRRYRDLIHNTLDHDCPTPDLKPPTPTCEH